MYFKLQQPSPLYAIMKALIDRYKTCDPLPEGLEEITYTEYQTLK